MAIAKTVVVKKRPIAAVAVKSERFIVLTNPLNNNYHHLIVLY